MRLFALEFVTGTEQTVQRSDWYSHFSKLLQTGKGSRLRSV